jgi:hypothetical protein
MEEGSICSQALILAHYLKKIINLMENIRIMKTLSLFLLSFCLVSTLAFGQSNDEMEIRQLEKHWTELLDEGDTDSLLKI